MTPLPVPSPAPGQRTFERTGWVNTAPSTPDNELRHVYPAIGAFTVEDPGLRLADLFSHFALCQPCFFAEPPQQRWD
jgi:hypothetical protein